METSDPRPTEGLEVRSYFVRGRNALLTRADFGELYVDYYLHQGQHGYQHLPSHDGMLKETLAALILHCASRPWTESWAWTIHFQEPLLNLFVSGDNRRGAITGQIFTEDIKDDGRSLFLADVVRERGEPRRSYVEFQGSDPLRAVEQFYAQSEQRPGRYFQIGPEEIVMITAQPQCDIAWLEALDADAVRAIDQVETLSLLEQRYYRWDCGCNHERMLGILAPHMLREPADLFGDEPLLRMSCPRCGARYVITREALEAHIAGPSA